MINKEDKCYKFRQAAKKGDVAAVKQFLNDGIDPNEVKCKHSINFVEVVADDNTLNSWALNWAAHNGHKEVVEILINAGADPKSGNSSALHWGAFKGHKEVVEVLLAAGADPKVKDSIALRWATNNGHKDVVEVLLTTRKQK